MPRKKITATFVDKAKPPTRGRVDYSDMLFPGFRFRISDGGAKSFSLITRLHGEQIRVNLGRYPAVSLADARTKAREAVQLVQRGSDPREERRRARETKPDTFANVVEDFIRLHIKKKRPRTQVEYLRPVRDYLKPRWGARLVGDIHRRDIRELLEEIADERSPIAARRAYAVIRKFFNWAVSRDIIEHSPAVIPADDLPGVETRRERTLTDAEIAQLWPVFEELKFPFGPLLKMLLVTGQRRSEVATMRWDAVDLEARMWELSSADTKAARAHLIPLPPLAVEILQEVPSVSGRPFVFTTTGSDDESKPVSGFSRAKRRADEISGLDDWRIHDLRRTCATGMRRLAVTRDVVGAVLNHSPRGVTAEVYDRYDLLNEKRHALETWARKLTSIVRPTPDKVVPLRG